MAKRGRYIVGPLNGPKTEVSNLEALLTPEEREARNIALDRLRGGPRTRMKEIANDCDLTYDGLMDELRNYIESKSDGVNLGVDVPYSDLPQMWDDYELITGTIVPESKRDNPFTCAC